MDAQATPTKTITVHFAEAIFALIVMFGIGAMLAIGLDRQVQIERSTYMVAGK